MDEWIKLELDNSNWKNVIESRKMEDKGSRRTKDRRLIVELKIELWIEDKDRKTHMVEWSMYKDKKSLV